MSKMAPPPTTDGGDFKPAPAGLQAAICVDVIDLGWPDSPWGRKPTIRIVWQTAETFKDDSGKERRYFASKKFHNSLHKKATLRQTIESWLNKSFSDAAIRAAGGLDLDRLVGQVCALTIAHKPMEDGGTWADVVAVSPLAKGMERIALDDDYTRKEDRDDWQEPSPSAFGTGVEEGGSPSSPASTAHQDVPFGNEPGDGIPDWEKGEEPPPWDPEKDGPLPGGLL